MSHLLQMRGLKPIQNQPKKNWKQSHLLQMRGLKQYRRHRKVLQVSSHLLQMRGLKPPADVAGPIMGSRIFYRCVD